MTVADKKDKLESILRECGSGVLAFSGGVDSTLLARVGADVLGDRLLLVTATSPTYMKEELELAERLARDFGARHRVIQTDEFEDPAFFTNPPDRCFACKSELFGELETIRAEENLACVFDGSNADDTADFRPGRRAARKYKVRSPLREAGLTKDEIRELSRALNLPTWNHPPRACLASRFPYGTTLKPETMGQVARAENYLYSLGFSVARVRHYGDTARIEVPAAEIPRLADPDVRERIVDNLRAFGYTYVTLDLQGYRTGSMNETLPSDTRARYLAHED